MTGSPTVPAIAAIRDDTTLTLCAAAHVSAEFADAAIREYLIEPNRAIPPSPGIDAATVLREAVAARDRRLIRDWLLLAILVVFAIATSALAVGWVAVGLLLSIGRAIRRHRALAQLLASLMAPLAGIAGLFALAWVLPLIFGKSSSFGSGSVGFGVLPVILALLALAVLVLDRLAVTLLLHRSFQRRRFVAEPTVDSWPGERWVRTMGRTRYQFELGRVAHADHSGNLVAYRGYEPFVGAGERLRPVSFAISLDPQEPEGDHHRERGPVRQFTLHELYNHVSVQLAAMRQSLSLSPSGRLAWLTELEQVVVPVGDLLANYDDPATRVVLPNLDAPPRQTISPEHVAEVIERPREWMRYYRCFRLEAWNRDVAVSGYLHFGASDRQLYLEWIPCVLYPIAEELRVRDHGPSVRPFRLGLASLGDWVRLPGDLLFRFGSLFRRIRPAKGEPGFVSPNTFGTSRSLRELAAGDQMLNYFQDSDGERYVELLTTRMLRAIGEFLEERGISVTDFMNQAANVINNFGDNYGVNNFGSMHGDNHFGGPAAGRGARGPAGGGPAAGRGDRRPASAGARNGGKP